MLPKAKTSGEEEFNNNNIDDYAALRALAEELYTKVKRYTHIQGLEIEVRLCSQQVPITALHRPFTILSKHSDLRQGNVKAGVSKNGFEAIKNFLINTKTDTGHPPVETTTEDVRVKRKRYSYEIVDSGTERIRKLIAVDTKRRLLVLDIAVKSKDLLYDMRLSVNSETPEGVPKSFEIIKENPYTRLKKRLSIEDGLFRYDLTEVFASDANTNYEVEIEGCFKGKSVRQELSHDWLVELLARILKLSEVASK